ncbi:NEAT domain-containing protein [Haloimpatiens lingqiaonensis]|uniref:NEAT domain-containing protein n=1 Tax=Haloimpatiens lingqiaonensis TaxID=1380675 RepID=UPI0010FDEA01|nr:NEAT domain-containing protein [Haloimpatiens lingqiaonensis]
MKNRALKILLITAVSAGMVLSPSKALAKGVNDNNKGYGIVLAAKSSALEDGKYSVSMQTLKENEDDLSMAGQYIEKMVTLDVKNGDIYLTLKLERTDWMKNVKVLVDNSQVSYTSVKKEGTAEWIKFKVPSAKPQVKLRMNVVPMGNAEVAFRVVLQDDITKLADSSSSDKKEESTNKNQSKNETSQNNSGKKLSTKTSDKKVSNKVSNTVSNKVKSEEGDTLPQTGYPVGQAAIWTLGGLAFLGGGAFLRKRK